MVRGYKGDHDEPRDPLVVLVGEEREPHVGEDKVLREKVDEFKEIFGSASRLFGEVDECVVGLHYPTE